MKTRNIIIVLAFVSVLFLAAYVAFARPAGAAVSIQQWEYATVNAGIGQVATALVSDPEEKKQLDADLALFGSMFSTAASTSGLAGVASSAVIDSSAQAQAAVQAQPQVVAADELAMAKVLDYMGNLGWELSTEYVEISGILFFFKRPKQ